MMNITIHQSDKLTESVYQLQMFTEDNEFHNKDFKHYPTEAEIIVACSEFENVVTVHVNKTTLITAKGKTITNMLKDAKKNGTKVNLTVE